MNYRTLALAFVALAAVFVGLYGLLFYSGMILVNEAGITTGGVDAISGRTIQIACAVPAVLLTWMAFGFRKQLTNGAEQGLG
ncbi:MAG: hypothetical protein MUF53_13425 [Gemmatimonadaceae bacterium]|jgi:hypothetical protein|nr:hypothetical protein [Gemmatimonadaceae bacterium]